MERIAQQSDVNHVIDQFVGATQRPDQCKGARMVSLKPLLLTSALLAVCLSGTAPAQKTASDPLETQARTTLQKAVSFYSKSVARHGGYVYRYSADLSLSEGEGKTGPDTVWVQPPATPTVGLAYLTAWQLTREPLCLEAARNTAECLRQGQLQSGGWQDRIEFGDERPKQAYRTNTRSSKRARDLSSFDDDKTQSALRFLIRLDAALDFKDKPLHESVVYALNHILSAQRPGGGWPQVWTGPADAAAWPDRAASLPADWPRTYPGGDYWEHTTLNDNALADTLDVLWLAAHTYDDARYRQAALRGGQFLIRARLPEPQPAWAQQYNADMHPAWARKFEPPAISGLESQGAVRALFRCFLETGDKAFLTATQPALDYLDRSRLPDGQLARFYELGTNNPLYLTREYKLTSSDADLPTHYSFKVRSDVAPLREEFSRLLALDDAGRQSARAQLYTPKSTRPNPDEIRRLIASQDSRGAWTEPGSLRYHAKAPKDGPVIDSRTFATNLELLARYLAPQKRK